MIDAWAARTATPIAPTPVRWRRLSLAETVASDRASAACYRGSENIDVLTVVMPELKFSDVQRKIFAADLVIGADNTALEDAPKAFNQINPSSPGSSPSREG